MMSNPCFFLKRKPNKMVTIVAQQPKKKHSYTTHQASTSTT
jgi:hypothetical protein